MSVPGDEAGASDRAFALLQELLPQQLMSRTMHRLARSTQPLLRKSLIRAVLRAYPMIDLREAARTRSVRLSVVQRVLHARLAPGREAARRQ